MRLVPRSGSACWSTWLARSEDWMLDTTEPSTPMKVLSESFGPFQRLSYSDGLHV